MHKKLKAFREELPDDVEKDFDHLAKAEKAYLEVSKRYDMFTIECVKNGEIRSIDDINDELYKYIISKLDLN